MILRRDSIGLYLHVPFCKRLCSYCAFVTRGYRESRATAFVADLLTEIRRYGEDGRLTGRPVETVYFGGGTPTTLSAEQLLEILKCCRRTFALDPAAEITVEANPTTVEGSGLPALRRGGVNRISFGAQSFDDAELKAMGTPHTAEEIGRAVRKARKAGFANINMDLIYGLPRQSPARWLANLEAAIGLAPEHLSFYGLTIEEGSRLERDVARGRVTLEAADAQADLYNLGRERLEAAGYVRYEVSNFCRPGYACWHNLGYWTDREWLGLGPGAHSYINGDRFCNVGSLEEYHRLVAEGVLPVAEWEPGSPDLRLREAVAFGLRTVAGVKLEPLARRYGLDPLERFREPIGRLTREGWLVLENDALRPSAEGILLADDLAVAFL
jgi:oxygen-independent coproporphyrinogen-3 oxidase